MYNRLSLKFANIKNLWLTKGSNPREVTPIFSFFYIFQTEFKFSFFYKCRATSQLYEKSCNFPPLIFNELQANYMQMKVNCKTVIFNELQLYEINCIDIQKKIKLQKCGV